MNQQMDLEEFTGVPAVDSAAVRIVADQMFSCASGLEGEFCFATIAGKTIQHFTVPNGPAAVEQIVGLVERIAGPDVNTYFSGALFRSGSIIGNTGRTEANVVAVFMLCADFDGKHDPATRRDRLPWSPGSEVETSAGNYQCQYWLDTLSSAAEAKAVQKALSQSSRADACNSVDHLWRMPGTLNRPTANKIKAGRSPDPYPSRFIAEPEAWDTVSLEALRASIVAKYPQAFDPERQTAQPSKASGAPVDPMLLREALGWLDCNAEYKLKNNEGWRDIVAGAGSANCPEARQIAHEFCEGKLDRLGRYKDAPPSRYSGPDAVNLVLDSMPPKKGGVGVGTIGKLARAAGWKGTLAPRPKSQEMFAGAMANLNAGGDTPSNEEEPTAAEWVEAINKEHAVVRHGGDALVARFETDPQTSFEKISFMGVSAFKTLHQNKYVKPRVSTDEDGEEKKEPRRNAGKVWLDSPQRREYPGGVVFAPAKQLPSTFLNLYRGWHVTPAKGNWSLLRAHIEEIICQGNPTLCNYVLGWLACAVRNLDTPLGVALVLRGGQGAGKGILGRAFGHLFGPHFVQLAKADQILGRFNAALRDALLVFGDEAFYAADPRHDGALKALITEPLIAIEEKFRDPLMRANSIRLLLATNNDWAVPADADDRRFAVLDVGSGRRGDKAYFAAIYHQLEHGGYGAMLYDLLERDLTGFDVRDIPDTKARAEQKTNSLKGPTAWLHDVLQRGRIGSCPWEGNGCLIDKGEAYKLYADWAQQQREYRPVPLAAFGRAISRALGEAARSTRYRPEDHGSRPRQFEFSSLDQCRAAFASYLKTDQPIWEDASNED